MVARTVVVGCIGEVVHEERYQELHDRTEEHVHRLLPAQRGGYDVSCKPPQVESERVKRPSQALLCRSASRCDPHKPAKLVGGRLRHTIDHEGRCAGLCVCFLDAILGPDPVGGYRDGPHHVLLACAAKEAVIESR
jgi:hypothetical protein